MNDESQVLSHITDISGDIVTVDMNHPLAGKVLNFDIKVLSISP